MDCERPLNDLLSQCQSFGSAYRPSSQSRKISRGILVDSGVKCRPKSSKEDVVDLTEERKNPHQPMEDGKRLQSVQEGNNGKRSLSHEQQTSLLSSRAKKTSTKEVHDVSDGATEAKPTFSANHANLKPGVEDNAKSQNQPKKVVSGSKDVNAEVTNKLSFVPGQPIMPEGNAEKTQNRGNDTLRVSLWKILETVSSPHTQHPTDCNLKNEAKESDHFRKNEEEVNPVPKSIHSADTIESDSDCHNHSLRRSSARKRASNKVERNRKTEPSLHNNKDKRRKKVHPSREGFTAGPSVQNTGGSPNLQQKGERQSSVSDKCEIIFNEQENQRKNLQANIQRKSFVSTRRDNNVSYSWENSNFIRPNNLGVKIGSVQHPLGNTSEHPRRVDDSPKFLENMDCPNDLGHSSLNNIIAQKPEAQRENLQANTRRKSFVNTRRDNNVSFSWENSHFIRPNNLGVEIGSVQHPLGNTSEHPRRVDDSPMFQENMDWPNDLGHSSPNNTIAQKPENQRENLQVNCQRKSLVNTRRDTNVSFSWENSNFIRPNNLGVETGFVQHPLGNTSEHPRRVDDSPMLQENMDCPKDLGHSSLNNTGAQMPDAESPTFKLQTPTESATCYQPCEMNTPGMGLSYGSLFKHVSSLGCGGLDDHASQEKSGIKGIKSFKKLLASRQNDFQPEDLQDTVGKFQKPAVVEKSAKGILEATIERSESEASEEDRKSESSEEDRKSESSEEDREYDPTMEDWNKQGRVESESPSPENVLPAKEASVFVKDKKQFYQGGFRVAGFDTNLASEKGTSKRHLGSTDQQDELSRAVALFSSALEGLKSKMQSAARKRSADILMSVADKIQLQLQNTESNIQADVQKLSCSSKSRKKHLERRCEELQRELDAMHRNFKEEVNKHHQKCKSTVEGLEAQKQEHKVTVEKQRASRKKLIREAEKAIETDLNDAQTRISAVQNSTKGKMLELKQLVSELLKEGIIT